MAGMTAELLAESDVTRAVATFATGALISGVHKRLSARRLLKTGKEAYRATDDKISFPLDYQRSNLSNLDFVRSLLKRSTDPSALWSDMKPDLWELMEIEERMSPDYMLDDVMERALLQARADEIRSNMRMLTDIRNEIGGMDRVSV
jgi:hypothetical protein